ncbi:hypothetical protein MTO96_008756 [Rhipicephalus appendiculatus]
MLCRVAKTSWSARSRVGTAPNKSPSDFVKRQNRGGTDAITFQAKGKVVRQQEKPRGTQMPGLPEKENVFDFLTVPAMTEF